jgi:hypothetical protein
MTSSCSQQNRWQSLCGYGSLPWRRDCPNWTNRPAWRHRRECHSVGSEIAIGFPAIEPLVTIVGRFAERPTCTHPCLSPSYFCSCWC